MPEVERTRVREREPSPTDPYETQLKTRLELRERAFKGKVVLHDEERPWYVSRQGRTKDFIRPETDTGAALRDWVIIVRDVVQHSGKHRHQGGLVLYIIEGEGYTEVDGEIVEWEAGDLLLLPLKPGGVEHKHFNKRAGEGCKWMAFHFNPVGDAVGLYTEQKEVYREYR